MSEILAPAGDKNSAYAAINSGADAIYLGLDKFSARSSAENFGFESFTEICRFAHAFGVKVYVALNTVIKDNELESFFAAAQTAWNCGADALILQDLFLGKYLKSVAPQIKLHLSTQAGVCNFLGAALAKECGFDRVILARETKLSDIADISKIIETEVFVQGALCTCFSGQCYMSSFVGGNSGNRGKCKQPCRKLYSIDRKGFDGYAYRLSLADLSVGKDIDKFIKAGVTSFKIEGRMRRPEYVSAAVKYYANILKGADCTNELSDLKRTYNRGNYTKGLAFGQDKSFISSSVQGHLGEFVGFIKVENSRCLCYTNQSCANGDGFKIIREGKEVGGGTFGGNVKGGFIVNSRDRLKNGDKVFITTDCALNARLLAARRTVPLKIKAEFILGKPARAEINGITYLGESPLEKAKNRPLTAEEIERCFGKVDVYHFSVSCEVVTDGVFMTASSLNAFRRKIYEEYFNKISESSNANVTINFSYPAHKPYKNNKTAVICSDLRGVKADIGILKPDRYDAEINSFTEGFAGEKFLFIPPYLTGGEIETVTRLVKDFDGIYCDSYFGLKFAEKVKKPFFAGTGFNITNIISLEGCKARYVCLSKELTLKEAATLSSDNTFYLFAGNIKVMDLIYCPFEKKCASCDKRKLYTITDTDGRKFPLRRYRVSECRFEVYNCADLVSSESNAGKLFDCTLSDNPEKIVESQDGYAACEKAFKNFTRGHTVNGIY